MLPQLETLLPRGGVHILTTFLVSLVLLPTLFHSSVSLLSLSPTSLSPSSDLHQAAKHALLESKNARKRSWIITGASSALMTLGSLPFVWDFVRGGMDVAKVGRREELAQGLTAFFLAYLAVDCAVGWRCYRSQFTVLTGWVHHSAYTLLLWYILHRGFAHVFALAAFMELPTLVLSIAMLIPSTRSDLLFTTLFFLTRIFFHAILLVLYSTPYGRTHGTQTYSPTGSPLPSLLPTLGLLASAPLHIMWFTSSLRPLLLQRAKAPPSPFLLPARRISSYLSSRPLPSLASLPTIPRLTPHLPTIPRLTPRLTFRRPALRPLTVREILGSAEAWRDVAGEEMGRVGERGLEEIRRRAERGSEEVRRFGGRVRRRVGIMAGI